MLSLNEIVSCFLMQSNTITQDEANTILIDLSNKEDFYLNSLNIFYSEDSSTSTKFFAIQVLKNTVQKRWICMRSSFQEDVRSFILSYFFDNPFQKETPIDGLVFQMIFSILFYEWPGQWVSFFNDLFDLDNSEITIILALKLLSFIGNEAKSNSLTSVGAFTLSKSLEKQIPNYFLFIQGLLFENEVSNDIVTASFSFLTSCIPWITADLFVESLFFTQLAENYFDISELADAIIPFLTELVISLDLPPDKQEIISQIFNILINMDGKTANPYLFVSAIKACYDFYAQVVEVPENITQYKEALDIILKITNETDDFENPELLEICLSFWVEVCQRLVIDNSPSTSNLYLPLTYPILEILYAKIPPPYFIITHIDELEIEHTTMENSQYHSNIYSYIKKCLIYLINLNENSVIDFFKEKADLLQSNFEKENPEDSISSEKDNFDEYKYNVTQLTWMIYSAAGTFSEAKEDSLLSFSISSLTELIKNLPPYVTINAIMAIFQYPRFILKRAEKLNYLADKLFEFLLNFTHEVDFSTIYILKTCSTEIKQLIIQQDVFSYLLSISDTLKEKLNDDCLIDLYHVYGLFLKEISDPKQKEEILPLILQLPSITTATDINLNKELLLCLKCHISLQNQIALDYFDFLKESNFPQIFQMYSNELSQLFQSKEKNQAELLDSIFLVKSHIINLISQFVTFCNDPNLVNNFIIPNFMSLFFDDFNESPSELCVSQTIKFAYSILLRSEVPVNLIYFSIFQTTFSILSLNSDEITEFHLPFYNFISALIRHHFNFLLEIKIEDLDEFIQALMDGCNHFNSSVSQLSFNLLNDFMVKLKGVDQNEEIFAQYCLGIVKLAFSILSNLSLRSNFDEITNLVKSIFSFQDEITKLGPEIVEELILIFPMANPTYLVELVKSLTECGPYLEGIRILLKDFFIELSKATDFEKDLTFVDGDNFSSWIRDSFTEDHERITEEYAAGEELADGIRSVSIDHH